MLRQGIPSGQPVEDIEWGDEVTMQDEQRIEWSDGNGLGDCGWKAFGKEMHKKQVFRPDKQKPYSVYFTFTSLVVRWMPWIGAHPPRGKLERVTRHLGVRKRTAGACGA